MTDNSTMDGAPRNTKRESEKFPVLIGCSTSTSNEEIVLSHSDFVIGRNVTASYNIPHICVSKHQCVFRLCGEQWTVCDMSKFGTYVNNKKVENSQPTPLTDGDELRFGLSDIRYMFFSISSNINSPSKKRKLNLQFQNLEQQGQVLPKGMKKMLSGSSMTNHNKNQPETSEVPGRLKIDGSDNVQQNHKAREMGQMEAKYTEEMNKEKLLKENKMLEKMLKDVQRKLEEKEREGTLLNKRLQEKEEQSLKDLKEEKARNKELEQEVAKKKALLETLKAEIAEKEEAIKAQLQHKIGKLQSEKEEIENDIEYVQLIKEVESAENVKRLQEELDKVKTELANNTGKKQLLEKELEITAKSVQQQVTESTLKAKQEALQNFGQLVETELQCSICNELFVAAVTLNCSHTFCRMCINLWKKKKKDCPVCRASIKVETPSVILDAFIDKIAENLTTELRDRRQEIVRERQQQELLSEASTSTRQQGRRGRSQHTNISVDIPAILISSDDASSDSEIESSMSTDETGDSDSLSSVEGDPDAYYGGYGWCYYCQRRGHWANGCPFR